MKDGKNILPKYEQNNLSIQSVDHYTTQLHHWLQQRFRAGDSIPYLLKTHTQAIDSLLITIWQQTCSLPNCSFVAIGGYGRCELFPQSDLDVLILYDTSTGQPDTPLISKLWDFGLQPSHAVRTVDKCIDLATEDIATYTALLDSRLICGNEKLFQQLQLRLSQDIRKRQLQTMLEKMIHSNTQNLLEQTPFQVEPDLKLSCGGLRDLQTIHWAACHCFELKNWEMMKDQGILTQAEYQEIQNCALFLYRLRFALHFITQCKDNRLLFELQPKLAQWMGLRGHGNRPVERLMKKYYQTTRRISELRKLLLQLFLDKIRIEQPAPGLINDEFVNLGGKIHVTDPRLFRHDPTSILRLFVQIATHEALDGLSAQTLRYLRESRRQLSRSLQTYPKCRTDFIMLLKHRRGIEPTIRLMHQHGVLAAYFRDWRFIIGMMQFDMFHTYTVDEHTIQVVRTLSKLQQKNCEPSDTLLHQIIHQINKPHLLLLAALFHDIGKGRKTPHTIVGAQIARQFCKQHHLLAHEQNLVVWLVENHLMMSMTVHKRDIHDLEVIRDFAQHIRDKQHLDYLYCLTVADIRATNPQLWNDWRQTLLNQLYFATQAILCNGIEQPYDAFSILRWTQHQALQNLQQLGYDQDRICHLWQSYDADYFIRVSLEKVVWHTQHILDAKQQQEPIVIITEPDGGGGTEIFIYGPKQPRLFSKITGVLERKNLIIQQAHITTIDQEYAFDTLIVLDHFRKPVEPDRYTNIKTALKRAITMPRLERRSHRLLYKYKPLTRVDTQVTFLQNSNQASKTSFELVTWDRPGLLASICDIFLHLDCVLHTARITTLGERVENVFVVTSMAGKPLNETQCRTLSMTLINNLNAPFCDNKDDKQEPQ